jgi:hypothetical protein
MRWRGLFSTFEESLWLSNQAALLFQTFDATLQFKDFFDDAKFSFDNLLSDFRTEGFHFSAHFGAHCVNLCRRGLLCSAKRSSPPR